MEGYIELPTGTIRYRLGGQGPAVVLVHGYLESLEVWDGMAPELEQRYAVLRIDLPGHGRSVCRQQVISMELMADCISAAMACLGIGRAFLVGHSMGGYAALAFAERYPGWLSGFCLLHSSPNADPAEKCRDRMSDAEAVRHGGKRELVARSIPRLFASQNLRRMSGWVDRLTAIGLSTADEGIVGALNGMAQRPDRNHVVEQARVPVLFIFGRYDNLIAMDTAEQLLERHKNARAVILQNSGHMGFIEERCQAAEAIASFLAQNLGGA